MVNQLQFTNPQAYSGGADFSPLANLQNVYKAAQEKAMQEAALAKLGADPTANSQFLIQSGVPSLASLGVGMQNKLATQAEDVRQFNTSLAEKQTEFKAAQANRDAQQATYDASQKLAQRKLDQDSPEYRGKQIDALISAGRLPPTAKDDPQWAAWQVTGQNIPAASISGPQVSAGEKKAIRDADSQVEAVTQTINQLDTMGENLKNAIHLGPLSGAVGYAASFLPEGYGKEAGVATEMASNEALRAMITQVKSAFGAAPSTKEDAWLLKAQASVDKSPAVQQGIIKEAKNLLLDKKKFYQEQAQDMRPEGVKGYYGKGHKSSTPDSTPPPVAEARSADLEAAKWAKANPDDPRAKAIIQHLKGK